MSDEMLIVPDFKRRTRRDWIYDHNPFYLLSGASMLVGCFLIFSQIHGEPEMLGPLLLLLLVFEIYGLLVVGLGLYLSKTPSMARDACYLLVLTCLLMLDTAFLYNETITTHFNLGLLINSVASAFAVVKMALICRILELRLPRVMWGLLVVELVLVFALPGVFRLIGANELMSIRIVYAGWWFGGMMLAVHAGPWLKQALAGLGNRPVTLQSVVKVALVFLPVTSVLGHIAAVYYVYDQPFYLGYLSPLLLAAAMVWLHVFAPAKSESRLHQVMPVVLCGVAIGLSLGAPHGLLFSSEWLKGIDVSPVRLVAGAAAPIYFYTWWRHEGWWLLGLLIAQCLVAVRMVPKTVLEWGIAAVALSFVLLGGGAYVSLKNKRGRLPQAIEPEVNE